VGIAEMRMDEAKNIPYTTLASDPATVTVTRNVRNITNISFITRRTVTAISDNSRVDITVTWDWKEHALASGNPYTYTTSTIVRSP